MECEFDLKGTPEPETHEIRTQIYENGWMDWIGGWKWMGYISFTVAEAMVVCCLKGIQPIEKISHSLSDSKIIIK